MWWGLISFFVFGLSSLVVPAGIIVIIVMVARNKSGSGEKFPSIIKLIYMYAVMIISLIIMIAGFAFTWSSTVNLILPEEQPAWVREDDWAQNERNRGTRNLSTAIATVVIGGVVFVYHGKKVKDKK